MFGQNFVNPVFQAEDFLRLDADVRRLALHATPRLMDHDARVRQRVAFALGARRQQHGAHAGRLADAIGVHIASEKLHGVVDGQARRHAAAGRVDVEMNVLLRIRHLQKEQLCDDDIGNRVVHWHAEEDDAVHQQARINIVTALAAPGLFDDHRDEEIVHTLNQTVGAT